MKSDLLGYCGRLDIIHLADRTDRYRSLANELHKIGIDISGGMVNIPHAPRPADANGFPSRGVYGNFLSHLDILRRARDDGLEAAWVLEDDAIFRKSLTNEAFQKTLVEELSARTWDICFIGHALSRDIAQPSPGQSFILTREEFKWSHCYLVHRRALPGLIEYLEATIERPVGDPEGGKLYIDGALSLYRRNHPEVLTLVSSPVLSIQRGSMSSLGGGYWYDRLPLASTIVENARRVRDAIWRISGYHWPGYS